MNFRNSKPVALIALIFMALIVVVFVVADGSAEQKSQLAQIQQTLSVAEPGDLIKLSDGRILRVYSNSSSALVCYHGLGQKHPDWYKVLDAYRPLLPSVTLITPRDRDEYYQALMKFCDQVDTTPDG